MFVLALGVMSCEKNDSDSTNFEDVVLYSSGDIIMTAYNLSMMDYEGFNCKYRDVADGYYLYCNFKYVNIVIKYSHRFMVQSCVVNGIDSDYNEVIEILFGYYTKVNGEN